MLICFENPKKKCSNFPPLASFEDIQQKKNIFLSLHEIIDKTRLIRLFAITLLLRLYIPCSCLPDWLLPKNCIWFCCFFFVSKEFIFHTQCTKVTNIYLYEKRDNGTLSHLQYQHHIEVEFFPFLHEFSIFHRW